MGPPPSSLGMLRRGVPYEASAVDTVLQRLSPSSCHTAQMRKFLCDPEKPWLWFLNLILDFYHRDKNISQVELSG